MPPSGAVERCHRCLQPVPINARRCPHCGAHQTTNSRRLTLYLAIAGIVAILALVGFSLYLKPVIVNVNNIPPSEGAQKAPPPKPAKKPPLD